MRLFRLWAIVGLLAMAPAARADEMRLAVTTSFDNSGLAAVLLPRIKADLDLDIQLIVVGTGQALRLGAAGDVDAILVHSRAAEEAFVADGYATHRRDIMYNDFVLIGPDDDPAGIAGAGSAAQALSLLAQAQVPFVSRGDNSGTHTRELALWQKVGVDPEAQGTWYRSVGASMGATLNTASAMNAYVMSDRASWLNFGNKGELKLLFAGDPALFNQYAYLPVNPARHAHIKAGLAATLERWLTSDEAAALINAHKVSGEQLFTFNARP